MIKLRKKILAVVLAATVGCMAGIPTGVLAETNDSLNSVQTNTAAANYRIPIGSFIQTSLTAYWTDDQWQNELSLFKAAKMQYIIFNPSLMMSSTEIQTIYPSQIPEYKGKDIYRDQNGEMDTIDACLRNCEKAGVKVFIALNQDFEKVENHHFWQLGWRISASEPDACKDYWAKNTQISNQLSDELYNRYKSKYPNAFYGWYWVHEFWNYTICTNAYEGKTPGDETAKDPTVYTDILAEDALSPVLDHLTQLDSSMPMIFSSFYNPNLCKSSSMTKLYGDIFKKTRFRPGDIWAPMDGLGGALGLDLLDEWTAAAKKATETNTNLHFWINNVLSAGSDDEVASLDRCVQQIAITSKYAEQNITFTWDHYYSPNNANAGYNETYMQYVNTGSIEKNAPSAVDASGIRVRASRNGTYRITWKPATDDVGIAIYNIWKDGYLIAHLHVHHDAWTDHNVATNYTVDKPGDYEIEAEDFAGNMSPRTKFTVSANPTTTTTTKTTVTDTTATATETTSSTGSTDTIGTTNSTLSSLNTTGPIETTAAPGTDTQAPETEVPGNTQSPKTGSPIPEIAILTALVAAGLGFAAKSRKIK